MGLGEEGYLRAKEEDVIETEMLQTIRAGGGEGCAAEEELDVGIGDHRFLKEKKSDKAK